MRSVDPSSPEAVQEALQSGMFEPEDTPAQKAALARLETLLALVEGWVDAVVTDAAQALPSAQALRETVRRVRATGGPAEQTFATLVGLELRPRRLREAAELWTELRAARGVDGRDAVWEHAELLPTADDLDDPAGFARPRRARPVGAGGDPAGLRAGPERGGDRRRPTTDGRPDGRTTTVTPTATTPGRRPDRGVPARGRRPGRVLVRARRRAAGGAGRQYLDYLAAHPDATARTCAPAHVTASALVLDPVRRRVLLTLHPKIGRWLQLGGHCEPEDLDLADAARREATEESGLPGLRVRRRARPAGPARGPLPSGRLRRRAPGRAVRRAHDDGRARSPSEESPSVRWWPVDALPDDADASVRDLVAAALLDSRPSPRGQPSSTRVSSPSRSSVPVPAQPSTAPDQPSRKPRARSVRG